MSHLFEVWDSVARRFMNIHPMGDNCLLELAPRKYFGKPVTLSDGTVLHKGVPVAEIHLANRLVNQIEAEHAGHAAGKVLAVRRGVEAGLYVAARVLAADPLWQDSQALWGITLIHRGVRGLGFEVYDLPPSLLKSITGIYLRRILASFHPQGEKRLTQRRGELEPKMLVMPRAVLLARYGAGAAPILSRKATPS